MKKARREAVQMTSGFLAKEFGDLADIEAVALMRPAKDVLQEHSYC